MNLDLLDRLLQALPLYSEEDDLREEIAESELLYCLPGEGGTAMLMCVRRAFEACALLDQRLLGQGKWAFVSFPAALFGHSLLQTLATPGQQIFESDYWRTDQSSTREEQRALLKQIETRRVRLHPTKSAEPIRYVFVAWGLIRLGRKFLLHHREDRTRTEIKNYVLPGGRFKPGDLPVESQAPNALRQLHAARSKLAIGALPRTLERELHEELALCVGEDYQATFRVVLDPYRRVEGTENKHSYTEYLLELYDISLTAAGEAQLLEVIADSGEKLVWFSVEDLVDPTGRTDGKRAFVDALGQHFGRHLSEFLEAIPSSSTVPFRFRTRAEAVELPVRHDEPVRVGETGKERPRHVRLTEDGHSLLILIAAHAKELQIEPDACHLRLLPGGWVKAESDSARSALEEAQSLLTAENLPLLQRVAEQFVRLSVAPEFLFFNEACFGYQLHPQAASKGKLELKLKLPSSVWSSAITRSASIPLAANMFRSLQAIAEGGVGPGDLERFGYSDETMKKNCKEMLDEKTRPFGLRKLVRQSGKQYQIGVNRLET